MTQRDIKDESRWENRFHAIEQEAALILAAEGSHHVRGIYFVLESDAYMARMVAAEKIVADRDASMDRYVSRGRSEPAPVIDLMEALKKSLRETAERAHCPEMSVADGAE